DVVRRLELVLASPHRLFAQGPALIRLGGVEPGPVPIVLHEAVAERRVERLAERVAGGFWHVYRKQHAQQYGWARHPLLPPFPIVLVVFGLVLAAGNCVPAAS